MTDEKQLTPELFEEIMTGTTPQERQMLLDLYKFRSFSGNEEPVRNYIINKLTNWKISYTNLNGNLIGMNHPDKPIISAHMDMVNTSWTKLVKGYNPIVDTGVFSIDSKSNIRLYSKNEKNEMSQVSLGADDKNGIWIALVLLSRGKEINFLFSHGEECGCVGIKQVVQDIDVAPMIESPDIPYALVLDRRGSSDIIGYGNQYCLGLDDKLQEFAAKNKFKYHTEQGLCSDANLISLLKECVNLSVGYYNAHTASEYTNLPELLNALDFVTKVLSDFKYSSVSGKRLREFKKAGKPYKTLQELEDERKKEEAKKENGKKYQRNNTTGGASQRTKNIFKEYEDDYEAFLCEVTATPVEWASDRPDNEIDGMICPICGNELVVLEEDIIFENNIDALDITPYYDRYKSQNKIHYTCDGCSGEFTAWDIRV